MERCGEWYQGRKSVTLGIQSSRAAASGSGFRPRPGFPEELRGLIMFGRTGVSGRHASA